MDVVSQAYQAYVDSAPPLEDALAAVPAAAPEPVPATPAATSAAAPESTTPGAPAPERLTQAVKDVVAGPSPRDISVSFEVAENPYEIIVVYRDARTGELLSQFPPEGLVQLAEFFHQEASGMLLDQDV
jgi:uncharacterized FlaG/YvyC family protein